MKVCLVNPSWSFENSIYFGCREPHLPLELGYTRDLLAAAGHEVRLEDGHITGRSLDELAAAVAEFRPDMTVVVTAPSYLFWRCAPPELRVPREFLLALGDRGGRTVAVGPHGSATPETTLRKLGVEVVVRGECEEVVAALSTGGPLDQVPSIAYRDGRAVRVTGGPAAARFVDAPPLAWPREWLERHRHHHHRFDTKPLGPGAEVEASRGCPYACSFCAKIDFRDRYRRRDLDRLVAEIDGLIKAGVTYLYFIDEIFLPQRPLLEALVEREVAFGVQTRIDLWSEPMIDLLAKAGCVSVEAGMESITPEGREALNKRCKLSTEELADRLGYAAGRIPFVQANLIATPEDDAEATIRWRDELRRQGVWANDPVPLYPYPSSPDYLRLWGPPDRHAWERAHEYYLDQYARFSDIQEARPLRLEELEAVCQPV